MGPTTKNESRRDDTLSEGHGLSRADQDEPRKGLSPGGRTRCPGKRELNPDTRREADRHHDIADGENEGSW